MLHAVHPTVEPARVASQVIHTTLLHHHAMLLPLALEVASSAHSIMFYPISNACNVGTLLVLDVHPMLSAPALLAMMAILSTRVLVLLVQPAAKLAVMLTIVFPVHQATLPKSRLSVPKQNVLPVLAPVLNALGTLKPVQCANQDTP